MEKHRFNPRWDEQEKAYYCQVCGVVKHEHEIFADFSVASPEVAAPVIHSWRGVSNHTPDKDPREAHGYSARCSCGWRSEEYRGGSATQPATTVQFLAMYVDHRFEVMVQRLDQIETKQKGEEVATYRATPRFLT